MGWLLVLALVAFATSTAFKLVPHYLDYMTMKKIIEAVDTNKTLDITTVDDFTVMSVRTCRSTAFGI